MVQTPNEIPERDKVRAYTKRLASSLSIIARILLLTNAIMFLYSIFPLKPLNSYWHLKLIGSFLTSCTPALIACVIGSIAFTLNTKDKKLKARSALITKIASLLSIALMLIIPFQLYAGSKVLRNQNEAVKQQLRASRQLALNIQSTTNEQEFRALAMSLPTQPQLPDHFDAPFAVIKERALVNLRAGMNRVENDLQTQSKTNTQVFIAESIRNGLQALFLSLGFLSLKGLISGRYGPLGFLLNYLE